MNDLSPEAAPQYAPVFKQAFDLRYEHEDLKDEERQLFQVGYVVEDLETPEPHLRVYNPTKSDLIGVLKGDSIIYSKETPNHPTLRRAEEIDPDINKSHFQIDYMPSGVDISLSGTREQVLRIAGFLIKSGFDPETPINSSLWENGKWNNGTAERHPGTLENPNV